MESKIKIIFDKIVTTAFERRASDVHFVVGSAPILRVERNLNVVAEESPLTLDVMKEILSFLLGAEDAAVLEKTGGVVFGYDFKPNMRLRVSAFYQKGKPSLSLRLVPGKVKSLDQLGLPAVIADFLKIQRGLLIISGPFGSGKSATVAAIIDQINESQVRRIVTLEKPIEYLFANKKSIIEQREIGRDVGSMADGLDFVETEDVDVVATSEIEDIATMEKFLALAEAGRYVITQMATDSVTKTLERIDALTAPEKRELIRLMLADNLIGVLNQRLLPRIGGGLVLALEILVASSPARSIIKDGKIFQLRSIIQTSRSEGMVSLDKSLAELVKTGEVLMEDALTQAADPVNLKAMAG